jgi:hypothetical protein
MNSDRKVDRAKTTQVMPEHATWLSRGTARMMNEACDAFFKKKGMKVMTRQELKNSMFAGCRKRKKKVPGEN